MQTNSKTRDCTPKIFTFLFFVLLGILAISKANAASLYFSPSSGSYQLGSKFAITIYVSSTDQAMNASEATVLFPADKLEIISISTVFPVEGPTFSNINGTAHFSGIVLNPGYIGPRGQMATINFLAKALGKADISMTDARILANDGLGTDILTSLGNASFNIIKGAVVTPVEPEPILQPEPTKPPSPKPTTTPKVLPSCATTTVGAAAPSMCVAGVLPYLYLKVGPIIFNENNLSLLLLILFILASAIIYFWGLYEAHQHDNDV